MSISLTHKNPTGRPLVFPQLSWARYWTKYRAYFVQTMCKLNVLDHYIECPSLKKLKCPILHIGTFNWFSLAQSVRSRTMNLFNWLYWSSAFESDPELSVRKLHILWGCELLELGLRRIQAAISALIPESPRSDLTGGNWQKWKRVFLTCPCHEIYRDEAVGLKSCKNTWKITIFVEMWNLGQYRENLIFCQ